MVEVHRGGQESTAAVGAWPITESIEHARLSTPLLALSLHIARWGRRCIQACRVPSLGSHPMTVRADDIAFRGLIEERRRWTERGPALGESKQLGRSIAMVEVHLVRSESPAAVRAGSGSQLPKKLDGTVLTSSNASDLLLAIPLVVGDVSRPLTPPRHMPSIERMVDLGRGDPPYEARRGTTGRMTASAM